MFIFVISYIKNSWPEYKKLCNPSALIYWAIRYELVYFQGMVLYHDRIVVPKSLQHDMLQRIHAGHQGRVRCKALARKAVYWNDINSHMDNMIDRCVPCLNTRKFKNKDKLTCHEVPSRPFQKVGADIFSIGREMYHLIIDYFSKWIEITKLM